jgi:hypothetical protein
MSHGPRGGAILDNRRVALDRRQGLPRAGASNGTSTSEPSPRFGYSGNQQIEIALLEFGQLALVKAADIIPQQ